MAIISSCDWGPVLPVVNDIVRRARSYSLGAGRLFIYGILVNRSTGLKTSK